MVYSVRCCVIGSERINTLEAMEIKFDWSVEIKCRSLGAVKSKPFIQNCLFVCNNKILLKQLIAYGNAVLLYNATLMSVIQFVQQIVRASETTTF